MDMEIADAPIAQQPLDDAFDLAPVDHVGVNHQVRGIVRPHREKPRAQDVGDDVWRNGRVDCGFPDEDRTGCPIRRCAVLVLERYENHPLARLGILQRDAAREAWFPVRHVPLRPEARECLVAEAEQPVEPIAPQR